MGKIVSVQNSVARLPDAQNIRAYFAGSDPAIPSSDYLLDDEFTDTRAAGAVNGTPAEPGLGTRTVVDTNGIMSLSGGVLVINGTPAANDSFSIGSTARVKGRVFKVTFPTITALGGTQPLRIGWSLDGMGAGSNRPGLNYSSPTTVLLRDGLGSIYTFTIGSAPHSFAFITNTSGGWTFARVNGQWVMLLIQIQNITTPMFPTMLLAEAVAVNFTMDSFRVAQSTYVPPMLAYSAFGGANGPLGNTDAIGRDGQITPILAWVDQVGTWAIATNKATASALAGGLAIATVPTASADVYIRIALTRTVGSVGGVARFQNSSNYLRFSHDGTNALCEQVVAGTPTTLRTGAAAFVANKPISLIVVGTTGWLFYEDASGVTVAIGASFTVPASIYANHGLYTTNTGNTMDVFEAWPYGTGGEHAFLGFI